MVDVSVKKIKKLLIKSNATVSVAESCTGGLISSYLTDISGSSNFIKQNFVTYSNEAKENLLGVSKKTIEKHGVVSSETALEMAEGLVKKYNADFGISTTGVLGPKLYDDGNPKGTVFIGFAVKSKKIALEYHSLKKTREAIKKDIVRHTLKEFAKFLDKFYNT